MDRSATPQGRRPLRTNSSGSTSTSSSSSTNNMKKPSQSSSNLKKKKTVANNTNSLSDFGYAVVLYILRRFVFTPMHIKIGIYFIGMIFLSLLKDFRMVPHTYFSLKSNIFNTYFVKMGWAWTLVLTVPFVFMTTCIYTGANLNQIRRHLTRTVIATALWYIFTSIFETIETRTGSCSNKSVKSKLLCKTNKHEWIGAFDISGHTFLLMHSLFFMLEEVKVFYKWDQIKQKIEEMDETDQTDKFKSNMKKLLRLLQPYIRLNFILIALLSLLWEIMLVATCLYFHTIIQKMLAGFIAVICWFLTYKYYYENESFLLSPGLPGKGCII